MRKSIFPIRSRDICIPVFYKHALAASTCSKVRSVSVRCTGRIFPVFYESFSMAKARVIWPATRQKPKGSR